MIDTKTIVIEILKERAKQLLEVVLVAAFILMLFYILTGCAYPQTMSSREDYLKQLYYHQKYTPLTFPWEERFMRNAKIRV